jgi:thioredoxin 1
MNQVCSAAHTKIAKGRSMIITVTSTNFENEILKSSKPVIIDAFATWCGPCKIMEPYFEELANTLGGQYIFAKLNVDEERQIAIQFGITSVPTFLFLKNGQLAGQEVGYMSKEDLEDKIKAVLG